MARTVDTERSVSDFPLAVFEKTYGDGSTLHVDVECDDALVIHTVRTVTQPEESVVSVAGSRLEIVGACEVESWSYFDLPAARRLHEAIGEIVAILEAPA